MTLENYYTTQNYYFDHLYIELTNFCNLNCKHCYMEASSNGKLFLGKDEIEQTLLDFARYNGRSVAFSGGEPLLHPEILHFIDFANSLHLTCSVITNSTLLDESNLKKLFDLDTIISLSIDGWSEKHHDYIRGEGNFRKVNKVIDSIIRFGKQNQVIICFTPMKHNYTEFLNLVSDLSEKGIRHFYLSLLEERGRQLLHAKQLSLSTDDKVKFLSQLSFLVQNPHIIASINLGHLTHFYNQLLGFSEWETYGEFIEGTIRIAPSGEVFLSAYAEGREFSFGNITSERLEECLQSPRIMKLLSKLKTRATDLIGCDYCPYIIICGGGSPARAYTKYNDMLKPDDYCEAKKVFLEKWYQALN